MIGSCALGCPLDTIDVTLVDAHKSAYNPIQPRDDLRSRKRPGHEFRNEIARKQKSCFKETAADIYGSPLTLEEKKRQKGSTSSAGNDRWQVSPEHQSRYNITLAEQKLRSFRVDYVSCFFQLQPSRAASSDDSLRRPSYQLRPLGPKQRAVVRPCPCFSPTCRIGTAITQPATAPPVTWKKETFNSSDNHRISASLVHPDNNITDRARSHSSRIVTIL